MSGLTKTIKRVFGIIMLSAILFMPISLSYAIDEEEVQLPEPQGACF